MPWSWVISFLVEMANTWLSKRRAEQALRDLGAATQAASSRIEAERQEATAKAAGEAALDAPDDPRDLRPE